MGTPHSQTKETPMKHLPEYGKIEQFLLSEGVACQSLAKRPNTQGTLNTRSVIKSSKQQDTISQQTLEHT